MASPGYSFVPLTRADYPLMRHWLAQPHVRAWWGWPEVELKMIERDMEGNVVDMRIVHHDASPFAYVQDYPAHHWPQPQFAQYPKGTRAIDTFIGEPAMLGRGHAARYLRIRARDLLAAGYPAVVIDPSPDNAPAVRAYRSAGFADRDIVPCEDGDPVLVMEFAEP